MAKGDAARIRAQLKHPVIDCDGHWQESVPVLLDYMRDLAGPRMADELVELGRNRDAWYKVSHEERMRQRIRRGAWWNVPSDTLDYATSMLPALMRERLDELGIDFAIIYPTYNLNTSRITQSDLRRALSRAYNKMAADIFAPYKDRMTPAAIIPAVTPDEAIDELDYSVNTLGLKVGMFRGALPRFLPAYAADKSEADLPPFSDTPFLDDASPRQVPHYVDTLGLDSPYDYDPLWQKCVDLKVAVTAHQGSRDWADRTSVTNFVFNHIGHVANANHAFTKALFLGGVVRRFPTLNFAFLEGGVGYGVSLLCDLIGHWEKRNYEAVLEYVRPSNLDVTRLRGLLEQYGYGALRDKLEDLTAKLSSTESTDRETEHVDDFAASNIHSKGELREEYAKNFYFGCEADDPMTAWAFDRRMGSRLKPVFSSDISHFDVPDMAEVLPEAFELVEKGLIDENDFRDFTFANSARLHGGMNPSFFAGTPVETAVQALLGYPTAVAAGA
jgi:predicted TIM-barrel fold metal-dependent hydrolase